MILLACRVPISVVENSGGNQDGALEYSLFVPQAKTSGIGRPADKCASHALPRFNLGTARDAGWTKKRRQRTR